MTRWLPMRAKRVILFFVMIAAGLGLGLLYGWIINPVEYVNTAGDSLRADYKADYVLMVAEIYAADENLDRAVQQLRLLGSQPASQIAAEGLGTATALGYAAEDIALLNRLAQALAEQTTVENPGEQP